MNHRLIFALLFIISLTSCAGIGKSLIKSPGLTVTDIKVSALSLTRQDIELKLKIDNPNPFLLPIKGFSYKFSINNADFINGFYDNSFDISANGSNKVVLKLAGDLISFLQKLDLTRLNRVEYKITGDIAILRSDLIFPYEYKGKLSINTIF